MRSQSVVLAALLASTCVEAAPPIQPVMGRKSLVGLVDALAAQLPASATAVENILDAPPGSRRDERGWHHNSVDYQTSDDHLVYVDLLPSTAPTPAAVIVRATLMVDQVQCIDPVVFREAFARQASIKWIAQRALGAFYARPYGHYVSIGLRPGSQCLAGVTVDERAGQPRLALPAQLGGWTETGRYKRAVQSNTRLRKGVAWSRSSEAQM